MSLDLHIHSTYSDGTLTPTELVRLAKDKGLTGVAITDHDTCEGVDEALAAGKYCDLDVIPGLEMSAVHGDSHLHLLGYCIDHHNPELTRELMAIQEARRNRNGRIVQLLQEQGIEITLAEVESCSAVGQTGRPHIARVLQNKGVVTSIDQAFAIYLGRGGKSYVPRKVLAAEDAIRLINAAGGVPVLAHPTTIDNSLRKIPQLVEQLLGFGLAGIEAYYPVHSTRNQKQLSMLAARYGLVVTGGSDYHGEIRPGTMLAGGANVCVPHRLLAELKKRAGH